MANKKEGAVSLEEAAEAFILLHDSGNYNGRRYDRVLGLLRDAVKSDKGYGPIMPDDERPDMDAEQEQAMEERVWTGVRGHDLLHPGGRLQKSREAIDSILKSAEEGTLALDGARKLAADAKAKAEAADKAYEDVQEVAIVPARPAAIIASGEDDDSSKKKKK